MPLPLSRRPDPVARETVASHVSRLAALNWIDAATFAADKGTSFLRVIAGDPGAVEAMAALGVTLPGELLDWSPVKSGGALRMLRGHAFPAKVILVPQIRGCPICLRADAAGSSAPPHIAMALRGHWLVPHVTLCLDHHHPLVPLWRDPQPGSRFESAARFREIADAILAGRHDQETREPTDFDLWIDARLSGTAQGGWLDAQPLHAAATFCHLLGTALLRLEQVLPAWVRRSDRWALYQMGFEVASQGKEAIRNALRRLQKLADGPQDGPKKVFPLLYDRLSHDYRDDPNFEAFRRILRNHLVETWPLGPGDELMGEPVTERRLHSVRTAAQATGIDQRRMRRMLAAAGIVPEAAEGTCDAWETLDAAAAQPILDDLTALMPANAFAEFIGASRSQFDLLVKDGVLAPALDAPGVKAVWSPVQGRAFLDGLLSRAVPLAKVPRGWEHLPKSAQRLKIGPGAIVTAIREGRIPGVGRLEGVKGYAAVHVNHADVTRVLGAESPTAQSIEVFAKSIGLLPPSRLKRLIKAGVIPATRLQNPKTRAFQLYITAEDATAFHRRYLTPRTLAQEFGRSWQSLTAELRAKGIQPFSPQGEDLGTLYLRADVVSALS
ncbi:TniQ family protein [Cereibacter azotoformans]|uniref:TniQ family protein n=1 Tax=Cereibacter azotoformans TaxID=43057 RepID=UPI001EEBFF01|nr:TniQ family protein [Cereibacter azotoformans]ULB11860.1 TniQ family protein [Cereibacter azotoformans]